MSLTVFELKMFLTMYWNIFTFSFTKGYDNFLQKKLIVDFTCLYNTVADGNEEIDLNDQIFGEPENRNQETQEQQRRNLEINSAKKSFKTSLILSLTYLLTFALFFLTLSDTGQVLLTSLLKVLAPTLTTIANFGKIQQMVLLYWDNFKHKINKLFKLNWMNKHSVLSLEFT